MLFYRAAVDARFGQEATAIDALHRALRTQPDGPLGREANEELAGALERLGRYGEAAQAWSEVLKRAPAKYADRADDSNNQQLNNTLRDVPPQAVHLDEPAIVDGRRNGLGSWNVPVNVNGEPGDWIFDTGANFSAITESEARRMRLAVRDTATYVSGSTGKKNPLRLAVANDVRFGGARLVNVVFLVLKDEAFYIAPLRYQIHGILGLPVIRALGRITMSAEGRFQIQTKEPAEEGEPNLFFDELTPLVAARHRARELQIFLDTGNNSTFLYPSSRSALSAGESGHLKKKSEQMGGAGGAVRRRSEVIPALRFKILGGEIELKAISLVSKQPAGKLGHRDGVFGADVLEGGFTLDFRSMKFRVP
jgi:predicted aspartyl protease